MSKITTILNKYKLFLKRQPRYSKAIIVAFILIGGCALFFVIGAGKLQNKVWLPDAGQYTSDDEVMYSLPVKSEKVNTKYGKAVRYATSTSWSEYEDVGPWTTIYEFRPNESLEASSCPNIANLETLLPSGCDKLGTVQGQPVYSIHRRLPSGAVEYYVKLENTFIYINRGGDGGQSLDYLNTFVGMPRSKVDSYLTNNNGQAKRIQAKQKAQKDTADKNDALAYTRLDFTPAIPTRLPSGWQLNTGAATESIQIDGPDADHPNMVTLEYTNKAKQFVSVHSGKIINFITGTQCGPSPGYSMENLACHKVAGTDYYEAALYDEQGDFVRYLYRPVGDSLVISHIVVNADGEKRPNFPTELAKIQDDITSSAQPTDKTNLKGSRYYKLFY